MNLRAALWQIESDFDRKDRAPLAAAATESASDSLRDCARLALAYHDANDEDVLRLAAEILASGAEADASGFAIQFAVSITEEIFDESARGLWLAKWNLVESSFRSDYCQYLRAYQIALSAFFAGQLREAERLFENALHRSENLEYPRGRLRSLFHLGLIAKERGNIGKARELFERARKIAIAREAQGFLTRIHRELGPIAETAEHPLERSIRAREWKTARSHYLCMEKERRRRRQSRGAESLHLYQGLIAAAFGKTRSYALARRSISDPVVQERLLDLKQATLGLSADERAELAFQRARIGKIDLQPAAASLAAPAASGEILGTEIESIGERDVRKFLEILVEVSAEVSKKEICREVWNISYDPPVHDGKLYKLVHRTRKALHRPDSVLNCYGAYRLNPILLGKAALGGRPAR